jgi:diguanylate cyclase (GGDEF)-like protein
VGQALPRPRFGKQREVKARTREAAVRLRDWLLESHCDVSGMDVLVDQVGKALAETGLAPMRVSVAVLPVRAALDGVQAVWSRGGACVEVITRAPGFVDEPEHLDSPLHTVMVTQRELRVKLSPDAVGLQPPLQRLVQLGATDYLAVPVRTRSRAALVFSMATDQPGGWDDEVLACLPVFLSALGLVVEVLDGERLLSLAATDPLTRVANRRTFEQSLRQAWSTCGRAGAPVSLLYIDVDHFKRFNDASGHVAGDRCLVRVAGALSASVSRGGDVVARIGGEEFAVVLPACDAVGAAVVGERLRQRVEALQVPHADSETAPWVTISVGGATLLPSRATDKEQLVLLADQAVYRAKTTGRNRYCGGS